ncbi:hypothetical protein [Kitasatospora sp. NPDC058492]|uniref:hypothetical protein n=2 Tax=unclassified Kitasatospora TaxID=2633591 RepID=UPI00364F6FF8
MTAPEPRPRLRPGVAVTPLRDGLHLRGRGTSLTLEGSRALPALWKLLEARLGSEADGHPEAVPARVEAALATVTARLREYDLLVDQPGRPGNADHPDRADHPDGADRPGRPDGRELPLWPASVAARPAAAAAALAAARPVVSAADPDGPGARAVARALARGGAEPTVLAEAGLPVGRVVAAVSDPPVAVAMQCDADGGFVTAPADPARVRADAAAVSARLRADATPAGAGPPPATLPALLAAATAQRLLCAVAGLPDPGDPDGDPRLLVGRPAVLVAEARPPRADYHPWAAGPGRTAGPPDGLAEALRRVTALGDPRLGVLDAPSPGGLPQLPAALVSCRTPAGTLVAGAARTDLARLAAACRAAELRLAALDPTAPVVGADPDHALGRALRRAAQARPSEGRPLAWAAWREHPQAAHWWAALARRLGHAPELELGQLADEQAFLAVVATAGTVLGRAVEATPADAVAVAALSALTRLMAAGHGLSAAHHTIFTGAAAPLAARRQPPGRPDPGRPEPGWTDPGWTDEGWTDRWIAELAGREPALRDSLGHLTGLRADPWQPATAAARPLANALDGCGFTVLVTTGGHP